MTLIIMYSNSILSINDNQRNVIMSLAFFYCYVECRYTKCHIFTVILFVIMSWCLYSKTFYSCDCSRIIKKLERLPLLFTSSQV